MFESIIITILDYPYIYIYHLNLTNKTGKAKDVVSKLAIELEKQHPPPFFWHSKNSSRTRKQVSYSFTPHLCPSKSSSINPYLMKSQCGNLLLMVQKSQTTTVWMYFNPVYSRMVPISTGATPLTTSATPRGPSVLCIPSPRIDVTWRNPLVTLWMHFLWGKIFRTCWANVVVEFQPNWNIYANVKLKHFPQLSDEHLENLWNHHLVERLSLYVICVFLKNFCHLCNLSSFFLDLCWKSCRIWWLWLI